jgi:zinc protease
MPGWEKKMSVKICSKMIALALALLLPSLAQAIPEIQHWQTDNGSRVVFVPVSGLPMVDIRIVFDAGSARDAGKSGLAALTNGLLAEGAGGLSAQQIAERFEAVGALFSNNAQRDMAYLGMRSLSEKKYLDTAIQALGSVLTSPDFPAEAFARELAHMKVAAESRQQSPGDIAEEAFYKAIYHDHPYASPVAGTPQSLQGLSIKDVRAFYQKYYVAKNAVIAIVGALDRAQAEALVTRISAALPAGERADDLPPVPEPDKAQEIRIDYPSQQSHIYVGQPGMKRADKDYMALYVANHPFGGSGFASRLVETVREKRGLAYSVYSYFMPMREAGPFLMALQTRSDQTEEALALLREELANYLEQGPSDAELQASINNISGSFPLNLDSNSKLLGYIAMIGFYDLPLDYLQSFVARVEAVSADEAHAAMQQRIHPDRLVTVVVGNGGAQKP